MKKLYKRIIAGILTVVTIFLACSPVAFASDAGSLQSYQPETFWGWLQSIDNSSWNFWKSLLDKDICPKSPNTNGRHEFVQTATTVDGKDGLFYVCRYCGDSADIVGKKVHQQQVDSLPAPGYNSAGRLIWQPRFEDVSNFCVYASSRIDISSKITANSSDTGFIYNNSGNNGLIKIYFVFDILSTPISGLYFCQESCSFILRCSNDGQVFTDSKNYPVGSWFHRSVGEVFCSNVSTPFTSRSYSGGVYASFNVFFPVYEIIPDTAIDITPSGQYGINSRPTAITGGNYGIVGDNGQITTVTNHNQIINETNNTYYNPATGQTQAITDWTYNYDGRIYDITLDTGDKVSVEYGDQNITITENTINEGDTIVNNYTIYYIIDGGSGETPGPSPTPGPEATPCPHAWAETSRTDPSCTAPGSASFSCSRCGETKTDKLPATGHTWQILRTVQTAYDEEGNLVQQGYTIYQCAVCSEQYKDDQGTGPPGGGQEEDKETIWDKIASFFGSIVDGIAGIFEAILGKLLDALTALSELLMGKVKDVVEVVLAVFDELPKLFGGFLDFLALIFPFLPAEITLLLTFGVIAVVFTGIIKALRR